MITATRPGTQSGHIYVSTAATYDDNLDFIAIERAVNGDKPVGITTAELAEAARILDSRGFGLTEISRRTGVSAYCLTVWRDHGWNPDAAPKRQPAPCGTPGGYRRHHRRGESACTACRAAHSADERVKSAARAARKHQATEANQEAAPC
ncbi:hypothetical protein ABZ769_35470 [Streptomyces olivoreticuli]